MALRAFTFKAYIQLYSSKCHVSVQFSKIVAEFGIFLFIGSNIKDGKK